MTTFAGKMKRIIRRIKSRMDQAIRRLRISKESKQPKLLEFWRNHGAEWARDEASYDDLALIGALAERLEGMNETAALHETVGELKARWRAGFAAPEDAFGWNEMNDGLPDEAFVAFVKGAGTVWKTARSNV